MVQPRPHGVQQRLKRPGRNAPRMILELGKGDFDPIEVEGGGWQLAPVATGGLDHRSHRRVPAHAEVV